MSVCIQLQQSENRLQLLEEKEKEFCEKEKQTAVCYTFCYVIFCYDEQGLRRRKISLMLSEFNMILKTWSDIVSDQPMFWSDMIGHLIILNRDRLLVVTVLETETVRTTESPKYMHNALMVNKITQYQ